MPSPFPGMDPYVERPAIWPDFHDSLIAAIRAALQPLLRPRFVALTQDRLFVLESDRPIRPDVSVVRTNSPQPPAGGPAVLEADAPAVFELWREEMREPLIHIIEPAAGNRIVTSIEVLSPDNKESGAGRTAYVRKREELWDHGANLVEIDLLRHGQHTVRASEDHLDSLRPFHYVVAVTRCWPSRHEVYAIPLTRRLPRVRIPLLEGDQDVVLDLQAVLARCWDEGPYPELLGYAGLPPGSLTPEEASWCGGVLTAAGHRKEKKA
jgi:Protein of unknown function (DUF4058)